MTRLTNTTVTDYRASRDDIERQVLLCFLGGLYDYKPEILKLVNDKHFSNHVYRECFKYLKSLFLKQEVTELEAHKNWKKYAPTFEYLSEQYITGANYEYYCNLLISFYEKDLINNLSENLKDATVEDYRKLKTEVEKQLEIEAQQVSTFDSELLGEVMSDYYEGFDSIKTGYNELDKLIGGLFKGESVILAGRPSMGKTAIALNLALNSAKSGKKVYYWSGEMKRNLLTNRLVCAEGKIDASRLRNRTLTETQIEEYIYIYENKFKNLQISFDDKTNTTIEELRVNLLSHQKDKGLDLVIIDYLGLLKAEGKHKDLYSEMTEKSRSIKILAGELNVPVITLCQLSRAVETRQNKRPILSDLRESGAIEQDADIVMFCYRDEYYNPETEKKGILELIIGKARNGETGIVDLRFEKAFQKII